MAHFAKVDGDGVVRQVIVVSNENCGNLEFPESEIEARKFLVSIDLDGNWYQTSYNNNFRGRYASIGMRYDTELDEFVNEPIPEDFISIPVEE